MSIFSIHNEEFVRWANSYKGPKFHALFCDSPYGISFMGKTWDDHGGPAAYQSQVRLWGEAMIPHFYPGALVFMFGGTRTWHRLAAGMEDAGFEMWDTFMWLHAQGLPKSQDIGKMLDKANGNGHEGHQIVGRDKRRSVELIEPSSPEAAAWQGYKTASLKPAYEPILAFHAPRHGMTYVELVTKYGTGALNVDGGRIPVNDGTKLTTHSKSFEAAAGKGIYSGYGRLETHVSSGQELGRYPANLILDDEAAAMVGNVSRYFYCAKASRKEREAGCEDLPVINSGMSNGAQTHGEGYDKGQGIGLNRVIPRKNNHPCVKPLALTRWLAALLLPPASVAPRRLFVPFAGSGSEMIGALQAGWDEVVGIEQNARYCKFAEKRIAFQQRASTTKPLVSRLEALSTFLYSGRKSWFVQHAAKYFWKHPCKTLIEPFAGSGVVGLSLLHARIIERLVLIEEDPRIVCLLNGLLHDPDLADRYAAFKCTRANVEQLLRDEKSAFRYLVQSRCCNRGRFDGGLRTVIDSRWCRDMVVENIRRTYAMRDRIEVIEGDALDGDLLKMMRQHAGDENVGCFADPVYTADIKSKGHTLYPHHNLDHQKLFSLLSRWRGPWLLTEDNSRMVRNLALSYRFSSKQVRMVTAGNRRKKELVLWRKRRIF